MSKYSHPEFDDIDYRKAAVNGAAKPRLLLHCCCAPCAAGCIERLSELFEVTFYYYNPNITDDEEYVKRFNEGWAKALAFPRSTAEGTTFSPP